MAPLPSTLPRTFSRITLRERPKGSINPSLDGKTGTFTLEHDVPMYRDEDLKDDEAIVQVDWISVDPAMRGWLNPTRSYIAPVAIGAPMRAGGVGRIVRLPKGAKGDLRVGDWVVGTLNWTQYAKVPVKELQKIQCVPKLSPRFAGRAGIQDLTIVGTAPAGLTRPSRRRSTLERSECRDRCVERPRRVSGAVRAARRHFLRSPRLLRLSCRVFRLR